VRAGVLGAGMSVDDLMVALNAGAEVHLWLRKLELGAAPADAAVSVLGPDERARAERFRRDDDRRRFILRHAHLRDVLARYLKTSPADVPLEAKLHQPPRLDAGDLSAALRFSLSSSGDHSAVALAWRRPVGVDIEQIADDVEISAVAKAVFSQRERQALEAAPEFRRRAIFFRIWTRKEAYVKARGTGLTRDLGAFDVMRADGSSADQDQAPVVDRESESGGPPWVVRDVHGHSEFALACCAKGDDWTILAFEDGVSSKDDA